MKFQPKTEKEIAEENLLQKGIYDFEVLHAEDAVSKGGNEMIVLSLHVFDDQGRARSLKDYLLESIAHKLRHASDACQLLDKYEAGNLAAVDFISKTGKLKIGIKSDKTGQYADKNMVADYVKRENLISEHSVAKSNAYQSESIGPGHPAYDPDIPF